jgi:uncharacterized protein YueI
MANKARLTEQIETDATREFLKKDGLEQAAAIGLSGPPQLRRWERSQFLGQFPEQVLWAITTDTLKLRPIPQEVKAALADSRCCHIFIKATEIQHAQLALQASRQRGLPVTVVYSPEFNNDVAIVITTTEAHSQEEVFIEPRR